MFQNLSRKRQRTGGSSREWSNNDESSSSNDFAKLKTTKNSKPLQGVVACLTGMSPDEKTRYHTIVERLGGRFTRDLNPAVNTHLIALHPEGAKYDLAVESKTMKIVKPSWLEECAKRRERVDEGAHDKFQSATTGTSTSCSKETALSLQERIDQLSDKPVNQESVLFSVCNFYLVGFDDNCDEDEKKRGLSSLSLGRLIRRDLGTIYWDFCAENITHVVVNDGADPSLRKSIDAITLQYPDGPVFVSPLWIIESLEARELREPGGYPPHYGVVKQKDDGKEKKVAESKVSAKASSLFKGSFFTILRVTPPVWAIDFDAKELERSIRVHGGQMLSLKLIEALKVDAANDKSAHAHRKCYLVGWGGYSSTHVDVHPLLSQIKRHKLCSVVEVTPIWLQTCFAEEKVVSPTRFADIFVPTSFPTHMICCASKNKTALRISVTGFSGPKRTALIKLVSAMGAIYDDSMKTSTTHLICREPKGQKYEKAKEWNLKIVSLEWLFHVAKYGFHGSSGGSGSKSGETERLGCEDRFPVGPSVE